MKLGYTTILHEPRLKLGISCNEYCLSDMVYNLSTNPKAPVNGWCSASQPMLGAALGVSRQSINTMIKKLGKVDILIKSDNGKLLKCGDTWINTVVSFNFSSKESLHPVKKVDSKESLHPVKKVDIEQSRKFTPTSKESLHNNNKDRNTNNNTLSIGQIRDLQIEREKLKAELRELTEKQPKPKRKRFSPPSIEQITEHFTQKGSGKNEAEKFFNFYESNGWKVGKNKMANWKAAATNWVKRNVPTAQTSPEQQTADTYTLPPKLEAQYQNGKKAFEKKNLSQRISYFNKQEFEGWMEKGKNFERWRDRGLLARQIYKKITDTILYFDTNSFVKNSAGNLQDFVTSAFEGKIKEL
jgi:hypothetical protein